MDAQHLENIMLSEKSERKDDNMRFHLCLMSRTAKSIEIEGTFVIVGGQGPGAGMRSNYLVDTRFPFGVIKIFWN